MATVSEDEFLYSVFSYALLQAAAQSDIEAVTDCLENGASLEAIDAEGRTALMLASGQPYQAAAEIVHLLLACGANHSAHDSQDNTATHFAARAGNDHILLILKAAGAPMDSCNLEMQSPLHLSSNARCTAILLGSGARCYLENKAGNIPMVEAIMRLDLASVELNLKYGAKPLCITKSGFNAVSVAWDLRLHEVLHLLYRYSNPGANDTDSDRNSPEFERWLAGALLGTPSSFEHKLVTNLKTVPSELGVPSAVFMLPALLRSEETQAPYFDIRALDQALKKPTDEEKPKYLAQMKERGNLRSVRMVPDSFDFSSLRENFPNFDKVSDFMEQQVELCRLSSRKEAAFMPVLLLGDPGVGKTRYLLEVSKLLGLEFNLIQCGGVTASFVLSGSSTSWKNGKPGKIHTSLRDGGTINPIVMLDELDKLSGSADYDAFGPLYQLLEKKTAKTFQDECIEIPMDCSHLIWVATANHAHLIPEAILSRLVVIDVPTPSGEALLRVAKSIYRDILDEFADSWGGRFAPALSEEVLSQISELTPRDIRKRLLSACGNAALRCARQGNFTGTLEVVPEDLGVMPTSSRAGKAGFIS